MNLFLDTAQIYVKAGRGGNGMVAFRREKYISKGGPWGGDGGRGGNVVLLVDGGLRTLMHFHHNQKFTAHSGQNGMSKGMNGRGATDLVIRVPQGTIVRDEDSGIPLIDLVENGQRYIAVRGGRGGRGNIRFATPKHPCPEISENGEPGQEKMLHLELKILADIGLIGCPSVGKSSLLSVITRAKPKIGSYPFTTIVPNLGMVCRPFGESFVVADLPGLIENASKGVGLGSQFLRHIERTRILFHVVDMSANDGRNPYNDYCTVNHELWLHDPHLLERPQIIVANKMDVSGSQKNLEEFEKKLSAGSDKFGKAQQIFAISSLTKQGLAALLDAAVALLRDVSTSSLLGNTSDVGDGKHVLGGETPFSISRDNNSTSWILSGDTLQRLFDMTNFEYDESVMKFSRQLRSMGVDKALRNLGAKTGDVVRIGNFEFEFID